MAGAFSRAVHAGAERNGDLIPQTILVPGIYTQNVNVIAPSIVHQECLARAAAMLPMTVNSIES